MTSHGALLIIPTYNEIESLPSQLRLVAGSGARVDILIVDDSSPDGTGEWVKNAQGSDPSLHLLERATKGGLGPAYVAGFKWAIEHGYESVIEMDADGSHPAAALPALLREIEHGADLAIGSRWVEGGRVEGWPFHRYLLSRLGNFYIRFMLRLPVRDATAGFRAYRVSLLDKISLDAIESKGYSFQTEMTMRAIRAGAAIKEIPIVFREREVGRSKMSMAIMGESLARVTVWAFSKTGRP